MNELEGNQEINVALREFEVKASVEQKSKQPTAPTSNDVPKMVKFIFKLSGGAIKEQEQAEYVLLGFVVVALVASFFLFFGFPSGNKDKAQLQDMIQIHPELGH